MARPPGLVAYSHGSRVCVTPRLRIGSGDVTRNLHVQTLKLVVGVLRSVIRVSALLRDVSLGAEYQVFSHRQRGGAFSCHHWLECLALRYTMTESYHDGARGSGPLRRIVYPNTTLKDCAQSLNSFGTLFFGGCGSASRG